MNSKLCDGTFGVWLFWGRRHVEKYGKHSPLESVYARWVQEAGYPQGICGPYDVQVPYRSGTPNQEYRVLNNDSTGQFEVSSDFASGIIAAIDYIEIVGLIGPEFAVQPSLLGASVAKVWMEHDPESYLAICRLNHLDGAPEVRMMEMPESSDDFHMQAIGKTWMAACRIYEQYCAGPKYVPYIFDADDARRVIGATRFKYDPDMKSLRFCSSDSDLKTELRDMAALPGTQATYLAQLKGMPYSSLEQACESLRSLGGMDESRPDRLPWWRPAQRNPVWLLDLRNHLLPEEGTFSKNYGLAEQPRARLQKDFFVRNEQGCSPIDVAKYG